MAPLVKRFHPPGSKRGRDEKGKTTSGKEGRANLEPQSFREKQRMTAQKNKQAV